MSQQGLQSRIRAQGIPVGGLRLVSDPESPTSIPGHLHSPSVPQVSMLPFKEESHPGEAVKYIKATVSIYAVVAISHTIEPHLV